MSDLIYDILIASGRPVFWITSSPIVIGDHQTDRDGAYLLASNHSSPYDIPILWRHCRRRIDFIALEEIFHNPLMGSLCRSMNSFPLIRARSDPAGVRNLLHRLANGRVVGFFPEGSIRHGKNSLVSGGTIRPGLGRLALMGKCPVIPAAIINSGAYHSFAAWLPLRKTRYGIAFGPPIEPDADPAATEARVVHAIRELHGQLSLRPEFSDRSFE